MTVLFNGATNGGANTVRFEDGDLKISGQAVGGKQSLDAGLIASVWGGALTETGELKAGSDPNDLNDATISIKASGGAAYIFAQLEGAGSFFGNFNPGQKGGREQSAEAIGSKLKDLDEALTRAKLRQDDDGNWEISMSGKGVQGRVSTNGDFASEVDAQAFLDSLRAEVGKADAYSVHVEDDDLDGTFSFAFSGWYQDVNQSKIEAALNNSSIEFDGDIGSRAEGAAGNLALFLELMAESGDEFVFDQLEGVGTYDGNFNPGQSGGRELTAEEIASKVGDLGEVLNQFSTREDPSGNWEVTHSGQGLSGRLSTNGDFASEQDALDFVQSLVDASPGFLDDALF
jgi:hypothetical protein